MTEKDENKVEETKVEEAKQKGKSKKPAKWERNIEKPAKWEREIVNHLSRKGSMASSVINRTFVEAIIVIVITLSILGAALGLVFAFVTEILTVELIICTILAVLAVWVLCCFLIIGVLHIRKMEKICELLTIEKSEKEKAKEEKAECPKPASSLVAKRRSKKQE